MADGGAVMIAAESAEDSRRDRLRHRVAVAIVSALLAAVGSKILRRGWDRRISR